MTASCALPVAISPGLSPQGCFLRDVYSETSLFPRSCPIPNLWRWARFGGFMCLTSPRSYLSLSKPPCAAGAAALSPARPLGFAVPGGGSSAPLRAPSALCRRRGWDAQGSRAGRSPAAPLPSREEMWRCEAPQPLFPPERSGDVRRAGCRRGLSPVPWVQAGNGAVAPLSPGGCRHKQRLTHFCG